MIILYHCAGARSLRCAWALEELGLPYELRTMPFPARRSTPDYLAINPLGTVPCLVDGDVQMNESAAILEYLCTRYDGRGLQVAPGDPAYGAWLNFIHYGEATLSTPLATMVRYGMSLPEAEREPRVVADQAGIFFQKLAPIKGVLAQHSFLVADRFTMADISVGYAIFLANYLRLGDRIDPIIMDYWTRLKGRPAYRAVRGKEIPGA